jgi:hypothetical protein
VFKTSRCAAPDLQNLEDVVADRRTAMPNVEVPPGWTHNPSAWRWRLPVLVLALAGCGIAVYLTLYQTDVLATVWEPFFGNGSRQILKESAIARELPVPDAAVGAGVYLLEAILEVCGGRDRWRRPGVVLALGAVAGGLVLAAVLLVILQAAVFHAFCTLCPASAACSLLAGAFAAPEVWAAGQQFRREHNRGLSWRQALSGRDA